MKEDMYCTNAESTPVRTDNTDTFKNALKKIVELTEENEQLKAQIEKMKCCGNCKNQLSLAYGELSCDLYGECKHCSKWELKE